jgi:hypothetical protein
MQFVARTFLFAIYQLQASANIIGDTYEKWKEETRLDIRAGTRTIVDGAQENTSGKIAKKLKRSEDATRQKAFSIGLSLDSRA